MAASNVPVLSGIIIFNLNAIYYPTAPTMTFLSYMLCNGIVEFLFYVFNSGYLGMHINCLLKCHSDYVMIHIQRSQIRIAYK